jgi:uncharacterized membrane protein YqjE
VTVHPDQAPVSGSAASVSTGGDDVSIGQLAKDASTHLSTIIRGEVELAKTELKVSVKNLGIGAVMFGAAAVILVFSLTFGLLALAEGLNALGIWRWASFLIVFGFLVLLAVILVIVGVRLMKKVKAPARTIETTKQTAAFLKHPTASA